MATTLRNIHQAAEKGANDRIAGLRIALRDARRELAVLRRSPPAVRGGDGD